MESETVIEDSDNAVVGDADVKEGPEKGSETTGEATAAEGEKAEVTEVVEGGEPGEAGEGVVEGGDTGETAEKEKEKGEQVEGERVEEERVEGEHVEQERVEGERVEGEHVEGEHVEGEHIEGEHAEHEDVEGEHVEGEHVEGEQAEGETAKGEAVEGEHVEGEELEGEGLMGEELEGEQVEGEETKQDEIPEEEVMEEEYLPEPPPDPAAPYDFSDSKEALKAPFELRPDQVAEVEQLWELYQNYTPAYTDLDGYITEKELMYMLKCLLIMTYTEEQFQELIAFCCRPPHEKGHISYEQFLKMVTLRQRDFPTEEEIRSALQVYDTEKSGVLDREYVRENLQKLGHKMTPKLVDNLIKEVDMSNDGTIGIEDIVGTMCIDLNPEDMQLLRAQVYPPKEGEGPEMELGDDF